jgi:hypothetical protein
VVSKTDVVAANGIDLLRVPTKCVTALIAGCRASEETKKSLKDIAGRTGSRYFEMNISRSNSKPYFIDGAGTAIPVRLAGNPRWLPVQIDAGQGEPGVPARAEDSRGRLLQGAIHLLLDRANSPAVSSHVRRRGP